MRFGMSDKLGPRAFGRNHDQPFLGREFSPGARLLRGDRARDRRRDPAHRRGGGPARQDRPGRTTPTRCTASRRSCSSARRSIARSSCACSTARPRRRSSRRAVEAPAAAPVAEPEKAEAPKPRRAFRALPSDARRAARRRVAPLRRPGLAPLTERYARGALLGVVNITPDSFSDGGRFARRRSRARAGPPAGRRGRRDRRRRRRVDAARRGARSGHRRAASACCP